MISPVSPGRPSPLYDVAIVGAGPAGGAAALALVNSGLAVIVVEKARPPRYKTCGGGVLWRARQRLPIDIAPAVDRECHVAELVHHAPFLQFRCRREHPIVSMVMRDQFDHLLVKAATEAGNVQLLGETTVSDVSVEPDAVRLQTSRGDLRARFVIAADGVNSVIAKKTGRAELRGVVPALECEVTLPEETMARWRETARFDFGLITAGYGWVFPKSRHLSIGVGTTQRGAISLPAAYRTYLERIGIRDVIDEERHGYMIPCEPRRGMFDIPRILFVGDAAGLADPVTAEGISAGIISGQLAARAIASGTSDPLRTAREYRSHLQRELLGDLRLARALAWLLYRRPRWCAALLTRHGQGMSELMTQIVTGESTYRSVLRRPNYYWRLLRPRRAATAH